ncbi:thrombopoietin isoform X2 [Dromiciops gliroides]|uniref:thrombopoietin isoform X2 n=1 Tax=Dromiciops gliroides TaxID=33562 RepID=UPI001CC52877|nr:thrombopoietin isoform X2 [Dromiciops gliroides]
MMHTVRPRPGANDTHDHIAVGPKDPFSCQHSLELFCSCSEDRPPPLSPRRQQSPTASGEFQPSPWPRAEPRGEGPTPGATPALCLPGMELPELLVVAMFLLTSRLTLTLTSPAPACDPRLFNKLLRDSAALHSRLSQCSDLGPLPIPVLLPTVDFSLREWRAKTTKGQEVLGAVTLLLEGVVAARGQLSPSCVSSLLGQLSSQTHILLGALQGFLGTPSLPKGPTAAHREPTAIFLSFQQLLRGKVRFLLHTLRPILCARQDQPATAAPSSGPMPSIRPTSGLKDRTPVPPEGGPGSSARGTDSPKRAFRLLNRILGLLNHTASPLYAAPAHVNTTLGPSNRTHAIPPMPSAGSLGNSNKPPGTSPIPSPGLITPPSILPIGCHVLSSPSVTLPTPTPRAHIPSTSPLATSPGTGASEICCLHSEDKPQDKQDIQGTATSSPT